MDDAVLDDLLELGLRDTKGGVDLVEGEEEVVSVDLHRVHVGRDAGDRSDLRDEITARKQN
jgi:hypothetical protein